jgi:hypothetical protein
LAIAPAAPVGGLFAALRTGICKNLGFTAIRAMLRPCGKDQVTGKQRYFAEVAEFCGFLHVNMN